MLKRKRKNSELDAETIFHIQEQLQILRESDKKNIFSNIEKFLSFIEEPGIRHLLSTVRFRDELIAIFKEQRQLLCEMKIIDWPIRIVSKSSILRELEGLCNTALGEHYTSNLNKSLDYFFTALSKGSCWAAMQLGYYHLALLSRKELAMPFGEYETFINNLLYPLKAPGYILAGQFYYSLCFYLHETMADEQDILHYMYLAIRTLLEAEALLPSSADHIYNMYGSDFETALQGDLVFLNEERNFSSIRDYCRYIQENFSRETGLSIDLEEIGCDLAASKIPTASYLNTKYALFAEPNISETPQIEEEPSPKDEEQKNKFDEANKPLAK